ncbi:50S ribosomal protein L13 [Candidatus Saccharibacteria bacterium]|nr:50S ribosomal protein L13 [Candidatus Saccharibacteria bacterium]MCL1962658.1 50S ribosomal protein L13 [Candidatus Saccharibacteria bacterium]
MLFKTFSKKAGEVEHKWVLIDVADMSVGRAATFIATRLSGKYDPKFTAHMDSGDNVVVINADKLVLTGNKLDAKKYYRHSGYIGNLHEESASDVPMTKILERAVYGMLPKNKLQADRMARLRIFADAEHDHEAQKPLALAVPKSRKETK